MAKADRSYEAFVVAWEGSETLAEVGTKLGISTNSVSKTAMKLRKEGVELKTMRANPERGGIDKDKLNAIIAKARQGDAPHS